MSEFLVDKLQEEAWSRLVPFFQWQRFAMFLVVLAQFHSDSADVLVKSIFLSHLNDVYELLVAASKQILVYEATTAAFLTFWVIPRTAAFIAGQMTARIHIRLARKGLERLRISQDTYQSNPEEARKVFSLESEGIKICRRLLATLEIWIALCIAISIYCESHLTGAIVGLVLLFLGGYFLSQKMFFTFADKVVPARLLASKL